MRDRGWILVGLGLFLGMVSLPFWYNRLAGKPSSGPELAMPLNEKECVEPRATMAAAHARMLGRWRDLAMRHNVRSISAANGKTYPVSLTGTCLQQCHKDKAHFCDRCHAFHGLPQPSCWNCHVDPQPAPAATAQARVPLAGDQHDPR